MNREYGKQIIKIELYNNNVDQEIKNHKQEARLCY